jgi:hypothetical protein
MWQQFLALAIILFFVSRQIALKRKGQITGGEFFMWLTFWLIAGIAIIFLKQVDELVRMAGFSSSGINVLLYIAVTVLFYMYIKLRLKIAKLDREITKISRYLALNKQYER